jgi:surface antigen
VYRRVACLLILVFFAAAPAQAIWQWLEGTPAGDFEDSDWELLKDTARKSLNSAKDGERLDWNNQATGNHGAVKPIMSFTHDGLPCRRLAFLNMTARGDRGVSNYTLCRKADDTWEYVSDSVVNAESDAG